MPDIYRERILRHLRSVHGVMNDNELLNSLINHGLVSDLCEKIEDVADCDLLKAYNATFGAREAA